MSLGIEGSIFRLPDTSLATSIQEQIAANGLETLFFKSLQFSLDFWTAYFWSAQMLLNIVINQLYRILQEFITGFQYSSRRIIRSQSNLIGDD